MQHQLIAFRKKIWARSAARRTYDLRPRRHSIPENRMVAEVVEAMRKAGTPPQIVYAFKKTGRLLMEGDRCAASRSQRVGGCHRRVFRARAPGQGKRGMIS